METKKGRQKIWGVCSMHVVHLKRETSPWCLKFPYTRTKNQNRTKCAVPFSSSSPFQHSAAQQCRFSVHKSLCWSLAVGIAQACDLFLSAHLVLHPSNRCFAEAPTLALFLYHPLEMLLSRRAQEEKNASMSRKSEDRRKKL